MPTPTEPWEPNHMRVLPGCSPDCSYISIKMDVHSKLTRSYNMSRVRGEGSQPERIVRAFLRKRRMSARYNVRELPGKPDFVLKGRKCVVFVHGCFWHGHRGCRYFVVPKTRTRWWLEKIQKNRLRDASIQKKLNRMGWSVMSVYECSLRSPKRETTLTRLEKRIRKNEDTGH